MKLSLPVSPYPKPRMTRSDKWKKRPIVVAYREWCDAIRTLMRGQILPDCGANIVFNVPMPASWSGKKRAQMDGQPHQQTPDLDNYVKALSDALNKDDSTIWHYAGLTKRWAFEGSIEIEIEEVGEDGSL